MAIWSQQPYLRAGERGDERGDRSEFNAERGGVDQSGLLPLLRAKNRLARNSAPSHHFIRASGPRAQAPPTVRARNRD